MTKAINTISLIVIAIELTLFGIIHFLDFNIQDDPILGRTQIRIGQQVLWTTDLIPNESEAVDLGSSDKRIKKIYGKDADFSGDSTIGGDQSVGGDLDVSGNIPNRYEEEDFSESCDGLTTSFETTYQIATSTEQISWNSKFLTKDEDYTIKAGNDGFDLIGLLGTYPPLAGDELKIKYRRP